jgi:hypothetical protein
MIHRGCHSGLKSDGCRFLRRRPVCLERAVYATVEPLECRILMSGTFVVNTTADGPDSGMIVTLRGAVASADGSPGSTITFSPSAFTSGSLHTISLTGSPLNITANTTIIGLGSNIVGVSGSNGTIIFEISFSGTPVTASISGLTITDGNAGSGSGGDVFNDGGTLTLSQCTVSDGTANDGGDVFSSGVTTLRNYLICLNSGNIRGLEV